MDPEIQQTETLMSVIAGLTARLNHLESQTPPSTLSPDLVPGPAKPTKCLPDVALFSGKRSDYLVWSTSARQKLKFDEAAIGGAAEQHAYLFSRMEAAAQNLIVVYFTSNIEAGRTNPQDFLAHLDTIFLDPNAARRALSKLYDLRQREDESFATFLPRFERLLQEAQVNDQRTAVNILERALNMALAEKLVMITTSDSNYNSFVQELHRTSSKLEQYRIVHGRRQVSAPFRPLPSIATKPQDPNSMDWEPSSSIHVRGLARLTDPERERLRALGACFRCRQTGHQSRTCPQNQRQGAVTVAAVASPEDQGNEQL